MSDLKPCPFCGGNGKDNGYAEVTCQRCDASATDNWNTRPVEDALRAERDELLRLVDGKVLITQEENENNKTLAAEVAERTKERNAQMERAGALKRVLFVANAEVATSLRERNDAIEAAKVCEDREAKFRAEVARLKEALEKYGFHDFECVMEDGGDTCSCGLLDAARER